MMSGLNRHNHPCFNEHAKGTYGRVHLPVATDCNIKCNYCNRKYDCVNESRPGVTSSVLSPDQAALYLERVLARAPDITVAGIAGPGDAFANPGTTMETLRLVRKRFPNLLLCVATNGLNIGPYIDAMMELHVSHITMTVNAVDPEIGSRIYTWVRDGRLVRRGIEAAKLLLERQFDAIRALKASGILVKVNTIVITGINDHHVTAVAVKMAELGVDVQNCMAMFPNQGTPFADIPEANSELMAAVRSRVENIISQMTHCTRCRSDAVGLLDSDRSSEFRDCLSECSHTYWMRREGKPYVAVATREGVLVNQHLGEADRFQIWRPSQGEYVLVEERKAPERGTGMMRWYGLAEILSDCRAVLVSGIGETPAQVLTEHDILPVEMTGFIQAGLHVVYGGGDTAVLKGRRQPCAKTRGCSGTGLGCG